VIGANSLYYDINHGQVIRSTADVRIALDSDNNDATTRFFSIVQNALGFDGGGTSGTVVMSVREDGQALFQNSANSATAFQVQNSSGTAILNVDTTNSDIIVTGDIIPSASDTYDLGGTDNEWDDLYIGNNGDIEFGNNQEAAISYDEAGDDRMELVGTGASLFIEDRLGLGVQTLTLTDDGTANDTLTPTTSFARIDQDETGNVGNPDLALSEASAKDGDMLIIVNSENDGSNEDFTITDSAGVVNVPAATLLGTEDSITFIYSNDRWVATGQSNN
jgi:hypothetical protein